MNRRRVWAVVIRHVYNFKHDFGRLTDSFYWPAIDIILWGLTSQYLMRGGNLPNVLLMFLSAMVFWQIIWRAQYEVTVNFLEELWNQNLVNLLSSPLKMTEWVAGVLTLGVLKLIPTGLMMGGLSYWLYKVNLLSYGWWLVPLALNLVLMGWWAGIIVSGLLLRHGRAIQTLAWSAVVLLMPFCGVFYPVSILPSWAQVVARWVPGSYVFEGMREVIRTGNLPVNNLLIALGLNLSYMVLALVWFKISFEVSRKKGLQRLE